MPVLEPFVLLSEPGVLCTGAIPFMLDELLDNVHMRGNPARRDRKPRRIQSSSARQEMSTITCPDGGTQVWKRSCITQYANTAKAVRHRGRVLETVVEVGSAELCVKLVAYTECVHDEKEQQNTRVRNIARTVGTSTDAARKRAA